jgi:NAD(P)-dependent dehydrogenase (short-subunit alcohol dehydrogenase family)
MSSITGAVVLVTGANGGIGSAFVAEALARGAAKVYATARTPRSWDDERIVPLALDITDPRIRGSSSARRLGCHRTDQQRRHAFPDRQLPGTVR